MQAYTGAQPKHIYSREPRALSAVRHAFANHPHHSSVASCQQHHGYRGSYADARGPLPAAVVDAALDQSDSSEHGSVDGKEHIVGMHSGHSAAVLQGVLPPHHWVPVEQAVVDGVRQEANLSGQQRKQGRQRQR